MSYQTSHPSMAAPLRAMSPPIFQHKMPKSTSKSEQLARAVAESQASPQIQYRPDSLWSEGGADVVWNGVGASTAIANAHHKGQQRYDTDRLTPSLLPSTSNTDSSFPEFTDANEGMQSDEDESNWDGANTTMTTVSTSDSRKESSHLPLNSTPLLKNAPPARPSKRSPARLLKHEAILLSSDAEEDADTAANSDGHSRTSSVGSSIWAGRGSRKLEEAPPMPASNFNRHAGLLHENYAFANTATVRQSVASSVYSQNQSPAFGEWDDSPKLEQYEQGDEKENMGLLHGKGALLDGEGKRRLADGTIIPKMPPMPIRDTHSETPLPRRRSKKGRQNRSPVMSYADGAEEEERLERERELQEPSRSSEVTSNMGPRLKKNSPAPWELPDEGQEVESRRISNEEQRRVSSRQSGEQLMPPNAKFGPSWARQSVESFRNRSVSNGSQSQQSTVPPMPPSLKSSANISSRDRAISPIEPLSDGIASDASTAAAAAAAATTRRSRAKSVSSGAVGVLKGLGLTSSTGGTTSVNSSKKAGKFGKALRGIGAGTRSASSSSSNGGNSEGGKRNRGISSEDFAHLPPSPLPDARFAIAPSPSDNQGQDTDKGLLTSSTSNAILTPEGSAMQRMASSSMAPIIIANRQSSSNDSHTGTLKSYATNSSSQYTAVTSPGLLPVDKRAEVEDLITLNGSRHCDQSSTISPKKAAQKAAVVHSSPSKNGAYSSDRLTASSPSKRLMQTQRSESATPTKTLSESKSSPALRPSSANRDLPVVQSPLTQGMSQGASTKLGAFENTPYKLISLEEARRQQRPAWQPNNNEQRMTNSSSNKSLDEMGEIKDDGPSRYLKNKKSGFLRRFAKDRSDHSDEVNAIPEASALHSDANEDVVPELRSIPGQTLMAPALSLRPMSSMFNGFAPGMLDPTEWEQKQKQKIHQNSTSSFSGNEQLSPVFTLSSHDGNEGSQASSQAVYEDANEYHKSPRSYLKPEAISSSSSGASSAKSVYTNASSALGLISDPSLPLTSDSADIIEANKAKAGAIEAQIVTLLGELVKLRHSIDENDNIILNNGVTSCATCGCNCVDQIQSQLVKEADSLKPMVSKNTTHSNTTMTTSSVLSRGRAVKPTANADAGKFGSYTNR